MSKARMPLLDTHVDLQVRMTQQIDRAVREAAAEMSGREKHVPIAALQWLFASWAMTSLYASMLKTFGPERSAEMLVETVLDAERSLESGKVVPLERALS